MHTYIHTYIHTCMHRLLHKYFSVYIDKLFSLFEDEIQTFVPSNGAGKAKNELHLRESVRGTYNLFFCFFFPLFFKLFIFFDFLFT